MSEANRNAALAGAVLSVAVAIGLTVWYAGSLEAEDDVNSASGSGQQNSAAQNYEMLEEQMSSTDKNGDVIIDETEVNLDSPESSNQAPTPTNGTSKIPGIKK